jgi:hypothetical protein
MDNWLILQNFYNGLTQSSRDHVDAAMEDSGATRVYNGLAAMGFVYEEVRGGINHAHITKEVMGIRILSVLTSLP